MMGIDTAEHDFHRTCRTETVHRATESEIGADNQREVRG